MLTLLLHARDAIVMRPHHAVAYARGYTTAFGHDRAAMARDLVVRRSQIEPGRSVVADGRPSGRGL